MTKIRRDLQDIVYTGALTHTSLTANEIFEFSL